MLDVLSVLICLGAGTIGGVFFGFSTFVMKAIAALPASQGVVAMQRINVVVLNPLFLGVFVGTALISMTGVILAVARWHGSQSLWLLTAGLLYFVGTFGVTRAFNIPRNERLAGLNAHSPEASEYWTVYVREWTRWNHVRTVASIAAAGCAAMFLAGG
jgi:uncharacterized membrane protein